MSDQTTTSTRTSLASLIRSHPLHVSYLVLLSPYILKTLSYLSPITLLALLCLFSASSSLLPRLLQPQNKVSKLQECPPCKTIFETHQDTSLSCLNLPKNVVGTNEYGPFTPPSPPPTRLTQESDEIETDFSQREIIKHMVCTISNPVKNSVQNRSGVKKGTNVEIEEKGTQRREPLMGIKAESDVEVDRKASKQSRSGDLSSCGSRRVEREWTRTLACKLFEDRHSGGGNGRGGDDGMDMLWEAYEEETESTRSTGEMWSAKSTPRNNKAVSRKGSRVRMMFERKRSDVASRVSDDDDVEEEEVASGGGGLCCLQALRMSSGKVNLGIGRKNMVRVSKALRGLGWFHKTSSGGSTRHLK